MPFVIETTGEYKPGRWFVRFDNTRAEAVFTEQMSEAWKFATWDSAESVRTQYIPAYQAEVRGFPEPPEPEPRPRRSAPTDENPAIAHLRSELRAAVAGLADAVETERYLAGFAIRQQINRISAVVAAINAVEKLRENPAV